MRTAIILALALTWLTPQMVADQCVTEASFAVEACACTFVNRLAAGWSPYRVRDAYYALDHSDDPRIPQAAPAQVATVAAVMSGETACGDEYFMFSTADVAYLGIGHYTPALVVRDGGREVLFFERWFRRK